MNKICDNNAKRRLNTINAIIEEEIGKRKNLLCYLNQIESICDLLVKIFKNGGYLYICGNGGSCSDSAHIAAEFIKDFKISRGENRLKKKLMRDDVVFSKLQLGLPAFSLSGAENITSVLNDIDDSLIFAQQIFTYGRKGDILFLLSTSGKSRNIINAARVARRLGVFTIGITGVNGKKLMKECQHGIEIKESSVSRIQEVYMELFHIICAVVERIFFLGG